jgi:hypothetical protein
MYVIIFSIDKNYDLYQELKNGGGSFKKSPQFCGAGSPSPLGKSLSRPPRRIGRESAELNSKHLSVTQKSYSIVNS